MSDVGFSVSDPRKKSCKSRCFSKNRCDPLKNLEFSADHFDSGTGRNGEFRVFLKMSDVGFSVSDPRKKSCKSRCFSKNRCDPLKNLEFSADHFDSGTGRNGEFRLFPEMSDVGFCVSDPRKKVVSRDLF